MEQVKIGIIGGSGLYEMSELTERTEITLETPFGPPSDNFVVGTVRGKRVAFLARHGRGHRILPGELNFRANIYAMKMLGVERILSASAVGSLREELAPQQVVLPDQFIDRTCNRVSTFFGDGLAAHIAFADPVCPELLEQVVQASRKVGINVVRGGTYVCMEGPAFSTKAESNLYRKWGMDVIGMTNLQEAKLAREAEICYVTMALVTDYDCWHDAHESRDGGHDRRQSDAEQQERAGPDRPDDRGPGRQAGLRLRRGSQERADHRPERHPGRDGQPDSAHRRKVPVATAGIVGALRRSAPVSAQG